MTSVVDRFRVVDPNHYGRVVVDITFIPIVAKELDLTDRTERHVLEISAANNELIEEGVYLWAEQYVYETRRKRPETLARAARKGGDADLPEPRKLDATAVEARIAARKDQERLDLIAKAEAEEAERIEREEAEQAAEVARVEAENQRARAAARAAILSPER